MIDLHLHTTASDGRSTPEELVARVVRAGVTVMAVTDHDTVAAVAMASAAAAASGVECVPGIEITAVHAGRDLHILGYFIQTDDERLETFLATQREQRRERVREIVRRLDGLGVPIDAAPLFEAGARPGTAVGRPLVARALVAAGHATDIQDAFDRFLAEGRAAFVERRGRPPADVIAAIRAAGGVASLAHPGKLGIDALIPDLVREGLAAIEAFHPDHSPADVARYQALADSHALAVTGGSDYHGPGSGRADLVGAVGLPDAAYAELRLRRPRAN